MVNQEKIVDVAEFATTVDSSDEAGLGVISIHNDVIAAIAHEVAVQVSGVADLSGDLFDGLAGMIGKKNIGGIRVVVDGDAVSLELNVILKHGYKIPDVATKLQQMVKDSVEVTGMLVMSVNVVVQGIKVAKESVEG